MLQRGRFPKTKTVLLVNDVPVKKEIELEEKFSSASNLNLLTSLRTGRVNTYNGKPVEGFKGILSTDIHTTYLDFSYFGEPDLEKNFDFATEFRKRKDLTLSQDEEGRDVLIDKEDETKVFYKLELQKDVYISERLFECVQALLGEIELVQPKLIIVTGKWALFFLTGCTSLGQTLGNYKDRKPLGGLVKFRSSIMQPHECWNLPETIIVPIYHTVHASGMLSKVPIMELDIQKLGYMYHKIKEVGTSYYIRPDKRYIYGTSKEVIFNYLNSLLVRLDEGKRKISVDIETMNKALIDCIGITDSIDEGICIPFATVDNPHFWSLEDEIDIMIKVREVLLHPNARHVGQNYSYEFQYYFKLWGIDLKNKTETDTMVLHHMLYNYLPKDLAFLASLYCEFYTYWKNEIEATKETPEQRWQYNIKDVCYTLEVDNVLSDILENYPERLQELYRFQQDRLFPAINKTMCRGVRIDVKRKEELREFFSSLMDDITKKINEVLGFEFNQNSTPQKKKLFSDFFGIELKKKKGGNETCDAAAMLQYIEEYPLYKPFLTLLLEYASLKVFVNNFLNMQLDDDNRARTAYNIAGTSTGRLASRKNVWGKGGNLMNVPEKGKINLRYAVEVLEDLDVEEMGDNSLYYGLEVDGNIILPNIKKIFLPDEGKEIADADYSGADAMVVAWDSECKWLIDFFSTRSEKLYVYIVREFLQKEIDSADPFYKKAKQFIHLTNYGGMEEKAASASGLPLHIAKEMREWYFSRCPEIPAWHKRIKADIAKQGYITNIFGRRGWFLDRNDPTLYNKAYSFIPQSTIADLVNHAMVNVVERHPYIDVLLQVHDSLVFQYPIEIAEQCRREIKECMEFDLPYSRPLRIPADMKVSTISYGDTEKIKKPEVRDYKIVENSLLENVK